MNLKKNQAGYMYEVPLIIAAVIILLLVIAPHLIKYPVLGKIAVVIGAVIVTGGLYYMIVIPGWQPSNVRRLRWPVNIIVFCTVALAIALGVIAILLK